MNKKELFEMLKDVPDNAEIFVWADHGQQSFVVDGHDRTKSNVDDITYCDQDDEINWNYHDKDHKKITAIRLS